MPASINAEALLAAEHAALLRLYGSAQIRSTGIAEQLAQLQGENLRLRARCMVLLTQLAWQVSDDLAGQIESPAADTPQPPAADFDLLASSLQAADLVICQSGCISHGDYWRVHDHCRRTGKACVFVDQPQALRIVRIDPASGQAEPIQP